MASPNGTGAVGPRWVRGWVAVSLLPMCLRCQCRAATCMRGATSGMRAAWRPITSATGTAAAGPRWVRGCTAVGSGSGGFFFFLMIPRPSTFAVFAYAALSRSDFTDVGDVVANGIAKWNGSSWSALGSPGSGMNGQVFALAASGSDVYAGGYF